jgi:uncharacterized protein (DUF2384 family)
MRAGFAVQQIRFAALAVFGDRAVAMNWLETGNQALGGLTPKACAQTKVGLLQVMELLHAIETGAVV